MKIGILTFQHAISYGCALQAAALRKVLSDKGHDARLLNHRCRSIDSDNAVFDFSRIFDIKYTIAHFINLPFSIKRILAFSKFRKEYLPLAEDNPENMDAVVVGSDQVWNYNLTNRDYSYFLNFKNGTAKKISYAPSFGISKLGKSEAESIKPLLCDFDYLSVREQKGAEIIKELTGKDVPIVLDPTLLLNQKQWSEIADKSVNDTGYIFVFTVFNDDKLWDFAEELSRKTGLPIKTISPSLFHRRKGEYEFTASPSKWLSRVKNADYVVTNSFHGLAFSINFEKKFYFNLPDNAKAVGSRIKNITERYGFASRNISGEIDHNISYDFCNEQLEKDRSFSMAYIDSFLATNNNGSDNS